MSNVLAQPAPAEQAPTAGLRINFLDPTVPFGEGFDKPVIASVLVDRREDGAFSSDMRAGLSSAVSLSLDIMHGASDPSDSANNQDNPLAYTEHELAVMASWQNEDATAVAEPSAHEAMASTPRRSFLSTPLGRVTAGSAAGLAGLGAGLLAEAAPAMAQPNQVPAPPAKVAKPFEIGSVSLAAEGIGISSETISPETSAAEGTDISPDTPLISAEQGLESPVAVASSSQVEHLHTKLKLQNVLNKIHSILHKYSIDSLSVNPRGDNICGLRGLPGVHVPPYPKCKDVRATLTSAFLNASAGGFRTKCDDPEASTYHFYKITTLEQSYHTCGPGPIPGGLGGTQVTRHDEFQSKLNHQGSVIERSLGLDFQQTTDRIGGNLKKITARYECPEPAPSAPSTDPSAPPATSAPDGVKQIVIHRNGHASAVMC